MLTTSAYYTEVHHLRESLCESIRDVGNWVGYNKKTLNQKNNNKTKQKTKQNKNKRNRLIMGKRLIAKMESAAENLRKFVRLKYEQIVSENLLGLEVDQE